MKRAIYTSPSGYKIKGHFHHCKKCYKEVFKTNYYFKTWSGYCNKCFSCFKHTKKSINSKTRKCISCKYRLPIENYTFNGTTEKHRRNKCLKCCNLERCFKINLRDYNNLLKKQNGKCKLCKKKEIAIDKRINKIRDLAVDHSHKTGKIRGLLCTRCNLTLGLIKDNIKLLELFKQYIKTNEN
jgi:hypothetical protein